MTHEQMLKIMKESGEILDFEILKETEDEKIIREVHEENPDGSIKVNIQLKYPIKYIRIDVVIDNKDL